MCLQIVSKKKETAFHPAWRKTEQKEGLLTWSMEEES